MIISQSFRYAPLFNLPSFFALHFAASVPHTHTLFSLILGRNFFCPFLSPYFILSGSCIYANGIPRYSYVAGCWYYCCRCRFCFPPPPHPHRPRMSERTTNLKRNWFSELNENANNSNALLFTFAIKRHQQSHPSPQTRPQSHSNIRNRSILGQYIYIYMRYSIPACRKHRYLFKRSKLFCVVLAFVFSLYKRGLCIENLVKENQHNCSHIYAFEYPFH